MTTITSVSHNPSPNTTIIKKDGLEYTTIEHFLSWRVNRFFQAFAMTVFTLGIGLCFYSVRERWKEAFTGKEVIVKKISEEQHQKIQNIAEQNGFKNGKIQNNLEQSDLDQSKPTIPEKITAPSAKQIEWQKKLDQGLVFEDSEQTNKILIDLFNESWLTPQHIDAFVNVTVLDLSDISFPISMEILQTVLKKCTKIQKVKCISKKIEEYTKPPEEYAKSPNENPKDETFNFFVYELSKKSYKPPYSQELNKLLHFLLKDNPQIRPFIEIPPPDILTKASSFIKSEVSKEFILIAYENNVDHLQEVLNILGFNVNYNNKEMRSLLSSHPKIFFSLFSKDDYGLHLYDNFIDGILADGKKEEIQSLITHIKCLSQDKAMTYKNDKKGVTFSSITKKKETIYKKGIVFPENASCSKRTEKLGRLLVKLKFAIKPLNPLDHSSVPVQKMHLKQEIYNLVFKDETEENIQEILDYVDYFASEYLKNEQHQFNPPMWDEEKHFMHFLFYAVSATFDESQKMEISDFLSKSGGYNSAYFMKAIAMFSSQSKAKDIASLFSHIKYISKTKFANKFIQDFISEKMKIENGIATVFNEFWTQMHQFQFKEEEIKLMIKAWLKTVSNGDDFKLGISSAKIYQLILESIPENLNESDLKFIIAEFLEVNFLTIAERKEVIQGIKSEKIKKLAISIYNI